MSSADPNDPGAPSPESPQGTPVEVIADFEAPAVPAELPSPPGPKDRWAHRRGEPRTFAALWLAYLFGAITVSLGAVGLFGLLSTDVYRPAARTLLILVAVGVAVLWPMARLSQEAPGKPLRSTFTDLFVVAVPIQAIVWPQSLPWMAGWPSEVAAALAALFLAWSGLIGGLLAIYFAAGACGRFRSIPRWGMMILMMCVVLSGPAVACLTPVQSSAAAAVDDSGPWLMTSPLTAVYELTRDRSWSGHSARVGTEHWSAIAFTGVCAAFSWGAALAVGMSARAGRRHDAPSQPVATRLD